MSSRSLRSLCCSSLMLVVLGCSAEDTPQESTTPLSSTAGDDGQSDDGPTDVCLGDAQPDALALETDKGMDLSGQAIALASSMRGVVACGEGFLDLVDTDADTLGNTDIDGTCTAIAIDGEMALVGTAQGTVIAVDLTGPLVLGIADVGAKVHGVAAADGTVYVAAGSAGVQKLTLSTGSLTPAGTIGSFTDARGVALGDDGLWIAAGADGVALHDASGAAKQSFTTDSPALGVRAVEGGVAVLRGVYGWDYVDANGVVSSWETTGLVLDAIALDGEVITVDGHALVRHPDLADADATRVFEERPEFSDAEGAWLRAAIAHGDGVFAALGDELVPLATDDVEPSPDIMVDASTMYLWGAAGSPVEGLFVVENHGDAELVIGGVEIDAPFEIAIDGEVEEVDGCPGSAIVAPGGTLLVKISYTPADEALVSGEFRIRSNDPDEPELVLGIDGNRPAPAIGSKAADFELLTTDGERFRLSEHLGRVILVKMFNFGCKGCAEEFGTVQADIVTAYSSAEFLAVGVNTSHRTAFAGNVVRDGGLTLPMTLDIDSAAFRSYRMPEKVFPLNVVVDRDGSITHVDAEAGLVAARAAIDDAM